MIKGVFTFKATDIPRILSNRNLEAETDAEHRQVGLEKPPRGLDGVRLHPVGQGREVTHLERPRAQEGLVQENLFIAIGHGLPVDRLSVSRIQFRPTIQMLPPLLRNLRENTDARAYIFSPFCVVCCCSVQSMGPIAQATCHKLWKIG